MKVKKIISAATVCAMLLSMASLPSSAAEETQKPVKVRLNPAVSSPFNNGEFEGWGTALCWWANRLGYSEELTQQAAKLFFSEEGLSLDIARYNIGGGDDPVHTHVNRSDSKVPGVWEDFKLSEDGKDVTITYDEDMLKDKNQLAIAKAALEANPDIYFEGFSNSPPYFMTNSGCSSGANNAWDNNLKDDMFDDFAEYIAEATRILKKNDIEFKSYSPMNEPDTGYWCANSGKQEGCHYSPGDTQSKMITETRKALDEKNFTNVLVAGMDETSIDDTVENYPLLSDDAKKALGRIDTHSYKGSNRAGLKELAVNAGKDLWMSEVDAGGDGAVLADMIIADMNGMMPSAWIMWDIVDFHKDSDGFEYPAGSGKHPEANNSVTYGCVPSYSNKADLWGVGMANHDTKELVLTNKYYAFGQFTKYIEPGDTIIASSDKTLAAYNKTTGDIKIVANNGSNNSDVPYEFDLSAFTGDMNSVKVIRTSITDDEKTAEKWAEITDGTTAIDSSKTLSTTLKANTITTFVIDGNNTARGYMSISGDDFVIKGETAQYTAGTSDNSTVTWSVSPVDLATINDNGLLTASDAGTVTVTATSTTLGSKSMEVTIGDIEKIILPRSYTEGSMPWNNDMTNYCANVVDGNHDSYFDGVGSGYVIIDLQQKYTIQRLGYSPRWNFEDRMVGGTFYGSNDKSDWTPIYMINSEPPYGSMTYANHSDFNGGTAEKYRYIKYAVGENGNCNVAEIEVWTSSDEFDDAEMYRADVPQLSKDTLYFVDCNHVCNSSGLWDSFKTAGALVEQLGGKLINTAADQTWSDGGTWGRNAVNTNNNYDATNPYNPFDTGYYDDEDGISYSFVLPAGTYTVLTGHTEWWNATNRTVDVSVTAEGGKVLSSAKTVALSRKNYKPYIGMSDEFTLDKETKITVKAAKNSNGAVLSWIMINGTIDKTQPTTFNAEPLANNFEDGSLGWTAEIYHKGEAVTGGIWKITTTEGKTAEINAQTGASAEGTFKIGLVVTAEAMGENEAASVTFELR